MCLSSFSGICRYIRPSQGTEAEARRKTRMSRQLNSRLGCASTQHSEFRRVSSLTRHPIAGVRIPAHERGKTLLAFPPEWRHNPIVVALFFFGALFTVVIYYRMSLLGPPGQRRVIEAKQSMANTALNRP